MRPRTAAGEQCRWHWVLKTGGAIINATANSVLTSIRAPSTASPGWLNSMLVVGEQQKVPAARLDSVFEELVPEG